jgi:hypothetical protein
MNPDNTPTIPDGFTFGFAPAVDPGSGLVRIGCIASPDETDMAELRARGFTHCEPMPPGVIAEPGITLFEFSGTITELQLAKRNLERLQSICDELLTAWDAAHTPGHFLDTITMEPPGEDEPEDDIYSESILGRMRFEVRKGLPHRPTAKPTDA